MQGVGVGFESVAAGLLTVLADVKFPEVDEVGDCRRQHREVIIWQAQSMERLAVEELLWRARRRKKGRQIMINKAFA